MMTVKELIAWLAENAEPDMLVKAYDGSYMNWHDNVEPQEVDGYIMMYGGD